ncbi:protein ATP6V1FNB [Sphaeramia orbicularis]|uniref:protein ATP6V1FNB n=1 Tax=Sphaeramia orbicularis TaxID=375764 RepID=UPI00117C04CB|nr:protein ATP6V1FNB [Sphaeramia orbicularis]
MPSLLTTQSQNCYREQIQKEMLTRLAWKNRYAKLFPSNIPETTTETTQPPEGKWTVLPPVWTRGKETALPPPPPPLPPLSAEVKRSVPPPMRPASPQTRLSLYQDSHQGKGRSQYLWRRGQMKPEEKFDFPLLTSWEYGWRLDNYTLDYRTPCCARSSVVKNTFYARNGVFNSPSATDTLG